MHKVWTSNHRGALPFFDQAGYALLEDGRAYGSHVKYDSHDLVLQALAHAIRTERASSNQLFVRVLATVCQIDLSIEYTHVNELIKWSLLPRHHMKWYVAQEDKRRKDGRHVDGLEERRIVSIFQLAHICYFHAPANTAQ